MAVMEFRVDRPGQAQTKTQKMSPRLQHAVRLLQMSSQEFGAVIKEVLGRNPFLEVEDGEDGTVPTAALQHDDASWDIQRGSAAGSDAPDRSAQESAQEGLSRDEDGWNDRDLWQADTGSGVRRAEGGELSALDVMAAETTLNVHLHSQLNLLPLTPRDLACARTIVESVDDDGYLRSPLESLLEVAALNPRATMAEMQIALKHVQSLEPAGVAARTVAECLMLQLPAIDRPELRDLARLIVSEHLQALASRDVAGLARRLGETPALVEETCDRIRRLDPRPGWRLGLSRIAYIVPDVVAKKVHGKWTVQLNPAVVPRVRLIEVYARLFQRHGTSTHTAMREHLHEARWTLRNVEQRFSTILDVAKAIVERQSPFLEFGAMAMKPLRLKEIAEAVGAHESTVCRVTNNKFISTPNGVFELKYFFSRAMTTVNGGTCSGTAIRGLIHDMIENESPDAPLCDAEITHQLTRQGLKVARRTVTKYRQMLKFESVERRRRLAGA